MSNANRAGILTGFFDETASIMEYCDLNEFLVKMIELFYRILMDIRIELQAKYFQIWKPMLICIVSECIKLRYLKK